MTTELRVFGYHTDNTVDRKEASIVRMIFFMYLIFAQIRGTLVPSGKDLPKTQG